MKIQNVNWLTKNKNYPIETRILISISNFITKVWKGITFPVFSIFDFLLISGFIVVTMSILLP